jgi:cell wall-associated NlpC family hydrolase
MLRIQGFSAYYQKLTNSAHSLKFHQFFVQKIPQMTLKRALYQLLIVTMLSSSVAAWGTESASTQSEEHTTLFARIHDFQERASGLVSKAVDFIGVRYKHGGNTPEQGLDCSGLVRLVFKDTLDIHLPRTALEISRAGEKIDPDELQPGDLVFYNTLKRGFSHVGIYMGDNKFIHAPSSGGRVRIESMNVNYWKKRFNGARRITY